MAESSSVTRLETDSNPDITDSVEHSELRNTNNKDSDEVFEMCCETCNRDGIHVIAYAFCISCVAYFCSTCLKYHGKFLPGHKYLEEDKMPQDICIEKCQTHKNEMIKFYCGTCETFACSVCETEGHTDTCSMKYLPDFVKDLENGEDLKDLITKKNDVAKELSDTKAAIDMKYKTIDSTTVEATSAIKKEKDALFAQFDQEVFQIEDKIQVEKKKDSTRVDSEKAKFDTLNTAIDHLNENIKNLKLFPKSQKYKLFMELKQLSNTLKGMKDSVECLKKEYSAGDVALESGIRVQAKDLTEKVIKFGTLMKTYNENSDGGNDDKKPVKVACPLDDINLKSTDDLKDCYLIDCCLLSEQYLIACDKRNLSLKLVDTKSKTLVYVRPVRTDLMSVTKINDTQIAIDRLYEKDESRCIIQFLTVTKSKTLVFQKRYILTEMLCYGIAYINDDRLVISMKNNYKGKLQILSLSGNVLANIEYNDKGDRLFSYPRWIALDAKGKHLYVSDCSDDSITDIDIENQENRKFAHRFWHPTGITTDREGFIYVCEGGTGRVHVYHPDDSGTYVLLDKQSANWNPLSICFSFTNNRLYLSLDGQNCIQVYKITNSNFAK
ncbi:uncharacterized protein LOC123536139 isoform X2 [Mercenaria mercenaria]|uniref:uncharacterized protein LOC123536139 isoform X2 n=1 Tax=Mercenaria mercenaria TaxID=6596 RepID=UPI00234E3DBF|nr:uncharacterized protein LOC123536139 isoform X2 [Mercenaria mercenaria]